MIIARFSILISVGLLIVGAPVLVWLSPGDSETQSEMFESEVLYVMKNVSSLQTDLQGQRRYEVRTPLITNYEDEHSEAKTPRVITYEQTKESWHISAEIGLLYPNEDVIELENSVEVLSLDAEEPVKIETQKLWYYGKKDLAITPHQVVVYQGDNILTGTGLRAKLNAGEIQLEKNVKGFYEN